MIKFFRKIRQRFLSENRFNKYLVYAIGEIVLVVIGILIALQINNWNEHRKTQLKSLNYLQRLQVDLDNVSDDVNNSIRSTKRKYNQALITLDALENKYLADSNRKDFESYLKRYFQFQITIQNTTAYHEMLSTGDLGLIENEWLRTAFSNLSDYRDFIIEVNKSNHDAYKTNSAMIEKHVRYQIINRGTDSARAKVSYNFDAMANDKQFINQISNQAYTWWDILRMFKRYQNEVNTIKDSMRIELRKFE